MGLKIQIDQDLKEALLSGQKEKANTLRILKSSILNEEIARGEREQGLSEEGIQQCLKKEAKKRQEAADLYEKVGSHDRAVLELSEKKIIEVYLPSAMSEEDISKLVDAAISSIGEVSSSTMGQIIGAVKQSSKETADGAVIARLVKEKLK